MLHYIIKTHKGQNMKNTSKLLTATLLIISLLNGGAVTWDSNGNPQIEKSTHPAKGCIQRNIGELGNDKNTSIKCMSFNLPQPNPQIEKSTHPAKGCIQRNIGELGNDKNTSIKCMSFNLPQPNPHDRCDDTCDERNPLDDDNNTTNTHLAIIIVIDGEEVDLDEFRRGSLNA